MLAKAGDDRREIWSLAERFVQDRSVDGVRIAVCTRYLDHGHTSRVTVFKRVFSNSTTHMVDPLVEPGEDAGLCSTPADFRTERARAMMLSVLDRYIDRQKVTPLEILHHDGHATRLHLSGNPYQGALQKTAVAQVANTRLSAQKRYEELMAAGDAVLDELRRLARMHPPPHLEPGTYGATARQIRDSFGMDGAVLHLNRAIAAYLVPAESWLDKLDRIGRLVEDGLEPWQLMALDGFVAEIISAGNALAELAAPETDRLAQLLVLIDLFRGQYRSRQAPNLPGIAALGELIAADGLPRTRSAARRRLLHELHDNAPLHKETALWQQAQSLQHLARAVSATPQLKADLELREVIELRGLRAVNPETVQTLLRTTRLVADRIKTLVRLAELMPYPSVKSRIAEFIRGIGSTDDIIRETVVNPADRTPALPSLLELQHALTHATLAPDIRTQLLDDIDTAVLDILKTDVMGNAVRPYMDRVLHMVKLCGDRPLPPGRARSFMAETIGRALSRQEILAPFLQRFKSDAERRRALLSLKEMLVAAGLGATPRPGSGERS